MVALGKRGTNFLTAIAVGVVLNIRGIGQANNKGKKRRLIMRVGSVAVS